MAFVMRAGVVLAGVLSAAPVAFATIYCADSPALLVADLVAAQTNGADDEVRIVAGTYLLTAAPVFSSNENRGIEISGGWDVGCNAPNSGVTVLNAQNQFRALDVAQNAFALDAPVSVHDLWFQSGNAVNDSGGGLQIFQRGSAVVVERNVMLMSHADQYGGGMKITAQGPVLVRNNLIFGNTSGFSGAGAEILSLDVSTYVTGNTIARNTTTEIGGGGGLYASGGSNSNFWIFNNILWNNNSNGAVDLSASVTNVRIHNDIGSSGGKAADPISSGNLSVDPQFVPCSGFCFNFHLSGSSALIDAGYDQPPEGRGTYDLDHFARMAGAHVDIGAYELDRIFSGGFD